MVALVHTEEVGGFYIKVALGGKGNFFERRVGDYQKASVMSSLHDNGKNFEFKMDEDF
ncbi:hypothetical protein RND71_001770 [Anisodus tanguticus]|uniref:Uncharacterized protein n=1 Tax=Anisodus tanguticus TaxID=243964 RepID=A0AAE1T1Y1_9SOLA|nr:hypothetical protein RND71_001770 [Anisodus tanguticus]